MKKNFVITMWTKEITDSNKDEYTGANHDGYPYKFRLLSDDGYDYGLTMIEYWNPETKEWEML